MPMLAMTDQPRDGLVEMCKRAEWRGSHGAKDAISISITDGTNGENGLVPLRQLQETRGPGTRKHVNSVKDF